MSQPDTSLPVLDGRHQSVLERLERDGYAVIPEALPDDLVDRCRVNLEQLYEMDPGVAAHRHDAGSPLHVEVLPNKGKEFETFFLAPRVLPLVEHLLGRDCVLQDVWSSGVVPGASPFPLHSDEPVAACDRCLSVVTIYPLVPFTSMNGATRVVPGSHRAGRHPEDEEPGWVAIEAMPGSCIMLLGGVWHGRCANRSDAVRSMMAAFFVRSWIRPNVDFTRVVREDVLNRASPEARRLFGFQARTPFVETWQWDFKRGEPRVGVTSGE